MKTIIFISDTHDKHNQLTKDLSGGLYISEKNIECFKDAFITFSTKPKLQVLTGDLISRYNQLKNSEWSMSTNLELTFDSILDADIKNNVDQDEMPTAILIMSDMEFNSASNNFTAYEMIENKFKLSALITGFSSNS